MLTKNYSWRRLVLALSILSVLAFSKWLQLPTDVTSSLTIAFGMAVQYFFQQHGEENKTPPPPPPQ